MKLTIIPSDNAVYKNGICYVGLDLSATPINIHALQFNDVSNIGWIEFKDNDDGSKPYNEPITFLPDWAITACTKWDEAKVAEEAAIAASVKAAADQPVTTGVQTA
jgi:hypothetical protein